MLRKEELKAKLIMHQGNNVIINNELEYMMNVHTTIPPTKQIQHEKDIKTLGEFTTIAFILILVSLVCYDIINIFHCFQQKKRKKKKIKI